MTDVGGFEQSVPGRFGLSARLVDGDLELTLLTQPELCRAGVVRASALAYLADALAGITVDTDPDVWTLTTDLSVRMAAVPAPDAVVATTEVVRQGRRSVTCTVDFRDPDGRPLGWSTVGFATVPRREGDPPKPLFTPEVAVAGFSGQSRLDEPLVEAARIEVLDAAAGRTRVTVTPELRNPAGTLQGAMVALLAEVAVEERAARLATDPVVVTDLDVRYLAQAPDGPVEATTTAVDDDPEGPAHVRLVDTSVPRLTTLVDARARRVRG